MTTMQRRQVLQGGMALPAAYAAAGMGTLGLGGCAAFNAHPPAPPVKRMVKSSASDGVNLAVYEGGKPGAQAVIFVHGYSQAAASWTRQMMAPELAGRLHLISYDLRGHGASDKPTTREAYHDSRRWADDLASVMAATGAVRPVVVAWSYGGRVIGDYLTAYGDTRLGAINMVAATSTGERFGLGRNIGLIGGMLADDPAAATAGTEKFLRACFEKPPSDADIAEMVAFNNQTPVAVRKLLGGRPARFDDVLRRVRVPMLITHGELDQISAVAMSRHTRTLVPSADLSLYLAVGHAPFYEDAPRFNRELRALARMVR